MSDNIRDQVGYLRRATEDNTYQISKFYDLLEKHMDQEDDRIESIDRRLTVLTVLMVLAVSTDLPWKDLLGFVRVLF